LKRYFPVLVTVLLAIVLFPACSSSGGSSMTVKKGDTVQIYYTGTLLDGTVFDSNVDGDPLQFTVGSGQLIEGLEKGIVGMRVGEKKKIAVKSDEAYGPHRSELVFTLSLKDFKEGATPDVGTIVNSADEEGNPIYAVVTDISGDAVTVDANHPLAGKDLVFDIEVVKVL